MLADAGEEVVDRVRLPSVDPGEGIACGVAFDTGRQVTIESLGRLIEHDRPVD